MSDDRCRAIERYLLHSDNLHSPKGQSEWHKEMRNDLREDGKTMNPRVFLVPSAWVDDFVKPDHGRKMYLLKTAAAHHCLERWDMVEKNLNGSDEALQWATTIPDEARWERA